MISQVKVEGTRRPIRGRGERMSRTWSRISNPGHGGVRHTRRWGGDESEDESER